MSSTPAAAPCVGTNLSVLVGTVVRPPEQRELPSGATVSAFEVRVQPEGASSETVPVTWQGAPPSACVAGEELLVIGRVRRRFFRAGGVTQSRTEVVAETIVPSRQRARARRALADAVEVVTSG